MFKSPRYPTSLAEAEEFVAGQHHGTLIATSPDGFPQVTILPFVKRGDVIEVHIVQADSTFRAICVNPKVTFLVSDFLAFTPHDWVDPSDGGRGTLHFRAVAYECEATPITEPAAVAEVMARLVAAYEPGREYPPIQDDDFYGARLRRLGAVRLRVVNTHAKFKLGPAEPVDVKLRVAGHLRERNEPNDRRAADVIEEYVHRGS